MLTACASAPAATPAATSGPSLPTSNLAATVPSTTALPATTAATPATTPPPLGIAALAVAGDGIARVAVMPSGVVVPVNGVEPSGALRVRSTCGPEVIYSGPAQRIDRAHVVLDAGHGGSDGGAFYFGLREADVNYAVASRVREILKDKGLEVILTRESDYYVPLQFRADIAAAAQAKLFVSIHHNAGGGSRHDGPGTEVYYQQQSAESKRAAGLLWEDIYSALKDYDIEWWGAAYAGAVYRQGRTGADFYGIIRRTGGVPAALVEVAYLSNRAEAELIRTPEFAERSAQAIARAIVRYFATDDPGAGFREVNLGPIPGAVPSGGVPAACREPAYE